MPIRLFCGDGFRGDGFFNLPLPVGQGLRVGQGFDRFSIVEGQAVHDVVVVGFGAPGIAFFVLLQQIAQSGHGLLVAACDVLGDPAGVFAVVFVLQQGGDRAGVVKAEPYNLRLIHLEPFIVHHPGPVDSLALPHAPTPGKWPSSLLVHTNQRAASAVVGGREQVAVRNADPVFPQANTKSAPALPERRPRYGKRFR